MTLIVPAAVRHAAEHPVITQAPSWSRDSDLKVESFQVDDGLLEALLNASTKVNDRSFARVIESVQRARRGEFDKSVPNLKAFPELFGSFLRHHQIDGWLYRQDSNGRVAAYLVTSITYDEGRGPEDKPSVKVKMVNTGVLEASNRSDRQGHGLSERSWFMNGSEVTKKTIATILADHGYLVETKALRATYDEQTAHHRDVLLKGFTEQFRFTGVPASEREDDDSYGRGYNIAERVGRKVINDTHPNTVNIVETGTSKVFVDKVGDEIRLPVPMAHLVKVFDLATHTFLVVKSADLTRHVYDSSLADKLVLPPSHRDLLDILTTDIATFTGDIIEGKSAGNVILAKGEPGVGKTLTAEVYSELIERPLYSVHSGALGITADSIRKNLETVFKRSKRWNAVLLLDEADVFVLERGTNITQNAIVAEFLRTLEYFDGLMFMTTNRAANIDEAILSRTAAIISYTIPGRHDQAKIWHVLAANFGVTLDDALVADLVAGLPRAAPRDVKMLLRLALRVAKSENKPLDVDVVQRSSMFRGVTWDDEAYDQHLADTGRLDLKELWA